MDGAETAVAIGGRGVWRRVPDLLEEVRRRWLTGDSAGEIAVALGHGLTRNAIIGRMHREGRGRAGRSLAGVPKPRRASGARPRRSARKLIVIPDAPELVPPPDVFRVDVAPPEAVAIAAVRRHHCRWPLDVANSGTLLCGCRRIDGLPYCTEHARFAFKGAANALHPMAAWS